MQNKHSIEKTSGDRFLNSPVPKHYRIRESLRQQIRSMESGETIPTEAELCELFGVSRITVRKAIEQLVYEGVVYRIQGKGTFVASPKLHGCFVQSRVGLYEDAHARGLMLKTQVLEQGIISANERIASYLNLLPGDAVFRIIRLRFIDQEPMVISYSYVPAALCPSIVYEDFVKQSLYAVMQQKYGVEIDHGERVIEAIPCGEEEADLLEIKVGVPLLVVTGTMYDKSNNVIEYGFAFFRGDRNQVDIQVVTNVG